MRLPDSVHLAAWPWSSRSSTSGSSRWAWSAARRARPCCARDVERPRASRWDVPRGCAPGGTIPARRAARRGLDGSTPAKLLPLGDVAEAHLVDVSVKANFRALGKRFGKGHSPVAEAIAAADGRGAGLALRQHGTAEVVVDGEPVALTEDEVVVTETPKAGWAVASDGGETLALDLELTPEPVAGGSRARPSASLQEARKSRVWP